jgi:PAS domain S-box-containing protein
MMKSAESSVFRSLLQAAPDGILVTDRSGRIVLANEQLEQMLGYSSGELVGQLLEVLVPEYIRPKHAALREGYNATAKRRPMGTGLELVASRQDGTTLPVEISLSPFEIDGQTCTIAVVRDVTDARRLERELKQRNKELHRSNEELEQFAYVASHDLQEPLRMIAGYTQLLQRRYAAKLDADANEYIGFAVDGVKRMQALINDLLTYSRVSTRSKVFTVVDLVDVARQALSNLEVAVQESKATVRIGSLPTIQGDPVQLTQLFQNLLGNAIKFHGDDGRPVDVELTATRDGPHWRLAVVDNGIGIDPEYAEKIFVIFQRLHGRERYPGTTFYFTLLDGEHA